MPIKTRDKCDLSNPREHLVWAFVCIPTFGGSPLLGHPSMFEDWSEHLTKAGIYDVEYLIDEYAEDGVIKIEDLPRRKIRFDPPTRGPQTPLNGSGKWVQADAPEPKKVVIPDLKQMTPDEIGGILEQAKALGYVADAPPIFDTAKVEDARSTVDPS